MNEFRKRLDAANARIDRGTRERTAGAIDKAHVIADEVARRGGGRGVPAELAAELTVSQKTISQALARARADARLAGILPSDTLERLLAAELAELAPLPAAQWRALAHVVRGIAFDESWIDAPGALLSYEIDDSELDEALSPQEISAACRGWTRVQALAVIDACQRQDFAALPGSASDSHADVLGQVKGTDPERRAS